MLLGALSSVFKVIVSVIGHRKLFVQIGYLFADLAAKDLLLDMDCLKHEFFSTTIFLLRTHLYSNLLHLTSLLLLSFFILTHIHRSFCHSARGALARAKHALGFD